MKIKLFKSPFLIIGILCCLSQFAAAQNMTLAEARSIALSNNYGIRLQQMASEITELQNSAGYAGMLPEISVNASYNTEIANSEQKFFNGEIRSVENAGANALDAGLYLNWTIFDGFAMFATRDKLNELQALGELQVKQQIETTIFDLNTAWYALIQLQDAEKVNLSNIAVSVERYNIAAARERLGAASRLDVLQAEVDLRADSAALKQTILQIKNIKANINTILGRDAAIDFTTSETLSVNTALNYLDILSKITDANIDLQIAKKDEAVVALAIKEYKAMLYPELNLTGGYGYLRSASEAGFVESNLNYGPSVGVSLSVPLFNGFTAARNIDIARIEQQQVATRTQQVQLEINAMVYTLYNQYATSLYLMQLEEKNVIAAKANTTIALEKFNQGNITSIELREIQQSLLNAQNRLLVETLNAKLAEQQLLKLSGQLELN